MTPTMHVSLVYTAVVPTKAIALAHIVDHFLYLCAEVKSFSRLEHGASRICIETVLIETKRVPPGATRRYDAAQVVARTAHATRVIQR